MHWRETAVTLVAGVATLMVVIVPKRPVDIHELGSQSRQWIAGHPSQ
jgi:hypothetical protein